MNIRRYIQAGAVWGWPMKGDPLTDARERYTVTGAPRIVESPWGLAMSFDGAADYVTLTAAEEFPLRFDSGAQDFSIAYWVRRGATGAEILFDKRDGAGDGWVVFFTGANTVSWLLDSKTGTGNTPVDDNAWHPIVVTFERGGNGRIYVDGVANGGIAAISSEAMATTVLPRIGEGSSATGALFTGDIAGIIVFDRVLTPEEALALAQPGRAF